MYLNAVWVNGKTMSECSCTNDEPSTSDNSSAVMYGNLKTDYKFLTFSNSPYQWQYLFDQIGRRRSLSLWMLWSTEPPLYRFPQDKFVGDNQVIGFQQFNQLITIQHNPISFPLLFRYDYIKMLGNSLNTFASKITVVGSCGVFKPDMNKSFEVNKWQDMLGGVINTDLEKPWDY